MRALRLGRLDKRQEFFPAVNLVVGGDRFTQAANYAFKPSLLGHFYNEDTDMAHSVAFIAYGKIILNPVPMSVLMGSFAENSC